MTLLKEVYTEQQQFEIARNAAQTGTILKTLIDELLFRIQKPEFPDIQPTPDTEPLDELTPTRRGYMEGLRELFDIHEIHGNQFVLQSNSALTGYLTSRGVKLPDDIVPINLRLEIAGLKLASLVESVLQ